MKYTNGSNQDFYFAKIRIEKKYSEDIQIMGSFGGSWEQPDYEDENLLTNFNPEIPYALDSMKNKLADIYNQLFENNECNYDLYEPNWVKKLTRNKE